VGFIVDRRPAHVLQEVVVRMHTIQGGVGGMRLVEVTEQVVDEMRKGLGSNHLFRTERPGTNAIDPPMVQ
jgi:hypothetical protein